MSNLIFLLRHSLFYGFLLSVLLSGITLGSLGIIGIPHLLR